MAATSASPSGDAGKPRVGVLSAPFYVCCAAHWTAMMLLHQSETQIWNVHFAGDFASQARVMGSVMSGASAIGFVSTPLLASWADAVGRKPVMLLGAVSSVVKFALIALRPTIGSIIAGNLIMVLNVYAWMLGTYACVGDVHGDDATALTLAQSRLALMPQLGMVICPVIGAKLATIDVRLPYMIATAAYALESLATLAMGGRVIMCPHPSVVYVFGHVPMEVGT
jgi:MFS family permease